jgi:Sulfotransferase domain
MRSGALVRHWLVCHELLLSDAPRVRHLLVVRYEDLVREPAEALRRVHEFIGVEPAAPAERLDPGPNRRYLARWDERRRRAPRNAYLAWVTRRYERRVARFGYSLADPAA